MDLISKKKYIILSPGLPGGFVMYFWEKQYTRMTPDSWDVLLLKGNHNMPVVTIAIDIIVYSLGEYW
jgi:hypothetical protein